MTSVVLEEEELARYGYDYENRMVSVSSLRGSETTEAISYIYDGDNVIAEYDDTGTLIAKYIYGPGIDEPHDAIYCVQFYRSRGLSPGYFH